MTYNAENDYYICAYGKRLVRVSSKIKVSKSNYKSVVTIYERENCNGCPYKDKCTKLKGIRDFMYLKIFLKNVMNLLKIFQRPKEKF